MIKKIQKYLLVHYPMLWNIKIVPMLLIIICLNILFFGIQYFYTDTGFENISRFYNYFWMNFFSVVVGCILLIGWFYFYNRNNALKSFYPRTTSQLYGEWLLIFIIVTGAILLPFSVRKGYEAKWKTLASFEETKAVNRFLKKIDMLIPSGSHDYVIAECFQPIPIPDSLKTKLNPNTVPLNLYSHTVKNGKIELTGYSGPSLLFYSHYYCNYIIDSCFTKTTDPELKEKVQELANIQAIKKWLVEGQTDSILALMTEFNQLQQKHLLESNLTPEQWLKRIYRPPFFSVDNASYIIKNNKYSLFNDIESQASKVDAYLPYNSLEYGYGELTDVYNSAKKNFLLTILCFSMFISIMAFSFRVTGGKSWLFALIATVALIFLNILALIPLCDNSSNDEMIMMFDFALWVGLFCFLLVWILGKIRNRSNKGKSMIYMNILLWLAPCIIPFVFFGYSHWCDSLNSDDIVIYAYTSDDFTIYDYTPFMFMINLIVMAAAMWFIAGMVRRWKSLGDE